MQVKNSYYYFKEALTPDQCQNIIDMGKKELKKIKDRGESTEATTFGRNHKQAFEKEGKQVLPSVQTGRRKSNRNRQRSSLVSVIRTIRND